MMTKPFYLRPPTRGELSCDMQHASHLDVLNPEIAEQARRVLAEREGAFRWEWFEARDENGFVSAGMRAVRV